MTSSKQIYRTQAGRSKLGFYRRSYAGVRDNPFKNRYQEMTLVLCSTWFGYHISGETSYNNDISVFNRRVKYYGLPKWGCGLLNMLVDPNDAISGQPEENCAPFGTPEGITEIETPWQPSFSDLKSAYEETYVGEENKIPPKLNIVVCYDLNYGSFNYDVDIKPGMDEFTDWLDSQDIEYELIRTNGVMSWAEAFTYYSFTGEK